MTPTNYPDILQSDWITDPQQPLFQVKFFATRVNNLIYYVTAKRGLTYDKIEASETPVAVTVSNVADIPDNSLEKLEELRKFISSPVKHG